MDRDSTKLTRLDISVRIRTQISILNSLLALSHLVIHQRLVLFILILRRAVTSPPLRLHLHRPFGVCLFAFPPDTLRLSCRRRTTLHAVLVHRAKRIRDTKYQYHQPLLGELGVVDEIGVDGILQITPLVVGKENIDGLGAWIAAIGSEFGAGFCGDAVVD
jgi:hypothetical protein